MRVCPVCGASLEGRRREAVVCSPACRIEHSIRRRLEAGVPVGPYRTLVEYQARRPNARSRRRNLRVDPSVIVEMP
jgi:hypothetical protein